MTGETLRYTVLEWQFARGNKCMLEGDNWVSDTTNTENDSEMKKEAEEIKLQRMAKVHYILEMWQCSHNLHAIQKESRAQNI